MDYTTGGILGGLAQGFKEGLSTFREEKDKEKDRAYKNLALALAAKEKGYDLSDNGLIAPSPESVVKQQLENQKEIYGLLPPDVKSGTTFGLQMLGQINDLGKTYQGILSRKSGLTDPNTLNNLSQANNPTNSVSGVKATSGESDNVDSNSPGQIGNGQGLLQGMKVSGQTGLLPKDSTADQGTLQDIGANPNPQLPSSTSLTGLSPNPTPQALGTGLPLNLPQDNNAQLQQGNSMLRGVQAPPNAMTNPMGLNYIPGYIPEAQKAINKDLFLKGQEAQIGLNKSLEEEKAKRQADLAQANTPEGKLKALGEGGRDVISADVNFLQNLSKYEDLYAKGQRPNFAEKLGYQTELSQAQKNAVLSMKQLAKVRGLSQDAIDNLEKSFPSQFGTESGRVETLQSLRDMGENTLKTARISDKDLKALGFNPSKLNVGRDVGNYIASKGQNGLMNSSLPKPSNLSSAEWNTLTPADKQKVLQVINSQSQR